MWFVAPWVCKARLKIIDLPVLHPLLTLHFWSVFCLFLGSFGRGRHQQRLQMVIFLSTSGVLWQSPLETFAGSLPLLACCMGGEVTSVSVFGKMVKAFEIACHCWALEKSSWLEAKQTEKLKEKRICLLTWSLTFIWNRKIEACTDMNHHHPCSVPCFLFSW